MRSFCPGCKSAIAASGLSSSETLHVSLRLKVRVPQNDPVSSTFSCGLTWETVPTQTLVAGDFEWLVESSPRAGAMQARLRARPRNVVIPREIAFDDFVFISIASCFG